MQIINLTNRRSFGDKKDFKNQVEGSLARPFSGTLKQEERIHNNFHVTNNTKNKNSSFQLFTDILTRSLSLHQDKYDDLSL